MLSPILFSLENVILIEIPLIINFTLKLIIKEYW